MKFKIGLFLASICSVPLVALSPDKYEIALDLAVGNVGGNLSQRIENSLYPTPDQIQDVLFSAEGNWYLTSYLGVECMAGFGFIQASSAQTKPLNVVDEQFFQFGPVLRGIINISPIDSLTFDASAGLSLNAMEWDNSFSSLFSYPLATISTVPGLYSRIGIK